ncbi:amidohydrolase family protein [Plantactinospora sp. DSM 117369]
MIVDAHVHLWHDPARGYRWLDDPVRAALRRPFTAPELAAEMGAAGVDRAILVEAGLAQEAEAGELLALAEKHEQIGGVVAWIDPSRPDLADVLAGYRALPGSRWLSGVRAHVSRQHEPYLDRAEVRRGLAVVAAEGLVFDLVARPDQLASAARAARDLPELTFVLSHLGFPALRDPTANWVASVAPLAACPNVLAKVSGLLLLAEGVPARMAPYAAAAVDLFGAERLMLGSDWPQCLLAAGYPDTWDLLVSALPPLGDDDRAAILGGTATRVYRS